MSAPDAPADPRAWVAWGQLLRISLTVSAGADVACGVLLGGAGWSAGPGPFVAIAGSLAVYHGGMALNDWADRAEDARVRPQRPIPSGRIPPGAALGAALLLLIAGPAMTASVDPTAGAVLAAVAVTAALYDVIGRGPLLGPLLLAACRFGNVCAGLLAGAALAGRDLPLVTLLLPTIYAVYVFAVSVLGRTEDDTEHEPGRVPPRVLHVTSLCLFVAPLTGAAASESLGLENVFLIGGLAAAIYVALPLQRAAARPHWTRVDVLPVMGLLLRRLTALTGVAALASGLPGALPLVAVLVAGFLLSARLRKLFPPS